MCLCLKYLLRPCKCRVELGAWEVVFFPVQRKLYILFSIPFLIYFGIVKIWPMYHNLEKRISFTIILLPLKEGLTLFEIWIFFQISYTFTYFVPFGVIKNRVTKINFKYFNGNYDYSSCPGSSILFLYAPTHKGLAF